MRRLIIFSFALCMLFFVVLLSGCSPKTHITWVDVNQKFIELEQERVGTLEALKDKPSISATKPSKPVQGRI